MGLIDEKLEVKKSCDTIPLSSPCQMLTCSWQAALNRGKTEELEQLGIRGLALSQ
jgi:hypothetical protein